MRFSWQSAHMAWCVFSAQQAVEWMWEDGQKRGCSQWEGLVYISLLL